MTLQLGMLTHLAGVQQTEVRSGVYQLLPVQCAHKCKRQ